MAHNSNFHDQLLFSVSEKQYQIIMYILQTTTQKWCGLLNCAIANDLERPTRSFLLFSSKIKCSSLFWSMTESPGDLMKDDIVCDLDSLSDL